MWSTLASVNPQKEQTECSSWYTESAASLWLQSNRTLLRCSNRSSSNTLATELFCCSIFFLTLQWCDCIHDCGCVHLFLPFSWCTFIISARDARHDGMEHFQLLYNFFSLHFGRSCTPSLALSRCCPNNIMFESKPKLKWRVEKVMSQLNYNYIAWHCQPHWILISLAKRISAKLLDRNSTQSQAQIRGTGTSAHIHSIHCHKWS